jgi:hypothetical protein
MYLKSEQKRTELILPVWRICHTGQSAVFVGSTGSSLSGRARLDVRVSSINKYILLVQKTHLKRTCKKNRLTDQQKVAACC